MTETAQHSGADERSPGERRAIAQKALAAGDQEFIQSLAKGLAVIEAFSETAPQMTLSEVSREVGLSPGSARRVLHTLQLLGYASCRGTRFELTPRVLQLGYSYLNSLPLANIVRPRLTELTEQIGANCAVSVLDGVDSVFVARTTAKSTTRERLWVGSRFPAHATSAGKLLLSELDLDQLEDLFAGRQLEALTGSTITSIPQLYEAIQKARADGWALSDQESMAGHRSITVPILVNGKIIAAVGAGAHIGVATVAHMIENYLPALREASEAIAQLLRSHISADGAGGPTRSHPRVGRA